MAMRATCPTDTYATRCVHVHDVYLHIVSSMFLSCSRGSARADVSPATHACDNSNTFYANLNTSDISDLRGQPETDVSVVQSRIPKAVLALKSLCELQEHLVTRACGEVWSSAWEWIQFFDECEKHRPGQPFFAKSWVTVVGQLQPMDDLFCQMCDFLIQHMNVRKNPINLQELIEDTGGVNETAALVSGGRPLYCQAPLREPLVANGLVECATAALSALCGPVMLMTERQVPLCVGVLVPHISTFPGFPWIKQALDDGLLRAIVLCAIRPMPILQTPLHFFFLRPVFNDAKNLADRPEFRGSEYAREWAARCERTMNYFAVRHAATPSTARRNTRPLTGLAGTASSAIIFSTAHKFDYRKGRVLFEIGPVLAAMAEYAARAVRSEGRVELHMVVVKEGAGRSRGHIIPLRSADGCVLDGRKAMARGQPVEPASPDNLTVFQLDAARMH
ncbi:hypothetical protein B0H19DRAFT_1298443 [Mycena capillaripes]|nr:hypothetical protein B0H19DRAFT_1298443 [Mycena capillaripes]